MQLQRLNTLIATALVGFSGAQAPTSASAAEVALPNVPLIVSIDARPNVWFQLDDSGSMDWEILAQPHFPSCAYDSFLQCSNVSSDNNGRMRVWSGAIDGNGKPVITTVSYVYDLDDSVYRENGNGLCDGNNLANTLATCVANNGDSVTYGDSGATVAINRDWRIRSSSLNVQFFNPEEVYEPWANSKTRTFANASFSGARSWPVLGGGGFDESVNLESADFGPNGNFFYHFWIDDKGFDTSTNGGVPQANPPSANNSSNGLVDQWDSFIKVTVSASSVSCTRVTHDPVAFSDSADGYRGINPTESSVGRNTDACIDATGGQTDSALRQNIANWFQYYRRRTHVARGAVGTVAAELPDFRYGVSQINEASPIFEIPNSRIEDYSIATGSTGAMLDAHYDVARKSAGTPLRRGLERIGEIYSDSEGPTILSCQKNFALLFSDGFWNGGDPTTVTGDQDGDGQKIGDDEVTVADVAYYYYKTDLRDDLEDAVPTDSFDSANYQHMVTYTIAFGLRGEQDDTDGDGWPNPPMTRDSDWYQSDNFLDKVDDMWHAAWNARGKYFNAARPADLYNDVRGALTDISARIGGAASAAANSGSISSTSRIFQAKFDSSDWHGELLSFPVNDDGTLGGAAVWDANERLSRKASGKFRENGLNNGRNVFTWRDSNTPRGIPFEWAELAGYQKNLLKVGYDGVVDEPGNNQGNRRLKYIRGVDSQEQRNGGEWRDRPNKLGDIVNSDPIFVGAPPFFYPFDGYQNFYVNSFDNGAPRTGMIYFGANDGMLHAVRESDGEEMFAYVPDAVIKNLPKLTDPNYNHQFYVDGSPSYGDAYYNGAWHSVLAGALRGGGQAIYALDITNPENFEADDVLWEFTDEHDADLGNVWGEPQIKLMNNGRWAVIVGNGMNNTQDDGNASTTGQGYLFIIYIERGIDGWSAGDYRKIAVPGGSVTTPNGLFTPAAADVDGDSSADFIYAGDLRGNMWKFDVSSTDENDWGVDFSGQPFFNAGTDQPITARPAIAAHPQGRQYGQLVLFGTGKYIETLDNTSIGQATQKLYALWDFDRTFAQEKGVSGTSGYSESDLQRNDFSVSGEFRVVNGGTSVEWFDENRDVSKKGWYYEFPVTGERMVRQPVLRDDLMFFVTLTPDGDPCSAGGTGFISVLDIGTGLAPGFPVFDVDGDQNITVGDDTLANGDPNDDSDNLVPVGINSPSIPNLPALIYDDRPGGSGASGGRFPPAPNALRGCDSGSARAYTFTTGSNGSILAVETATEALSCGRQNWSELR